VDLILVYSYTRYEKLWGIETLLSNWYFLQMHSQFAAVRVLAPSLRIFRSTVGQYGGSNAHFPTHPVLIRKLSSAMKGLPKPENQELIKSNHIISN
jgi:hypothetical protein